MKPWGMFTAEGTAAVEAIVRSSGNSAEAIARLEQLHRAGVHKEATDTAVREKVWAYFHPTPTHSGERYELRGTCEVCNTPTNWKVRTGDREAYWCGCGNGN